MLVLNKKNLTPFERKILIEVKSMKDIVFIRNRIDYIWSVISFISKFGHRKYYLYYPSLSKRFSAKDLVFYYDALNEQKEKIEIFMKQDEERFKKVGAI